MGTGSVSRRVKRPVRGVNHPPPPPLHLFIPIHQNSYLNVVTFCWRTRYGCLDLCRTQCSAEQQKRNAMQPDQGLSHWRASLHCIERSIKIRRHRSQETSLVADFIVRFTWTDWIARLRAWSCTVPTLQALILGPVSDAVSLIIWQYFQRLLEDITERITCNFYSSLRAASDVVSVFPYFPSSCQVYLSFGSYDRPGLTNLFEGANAQVACKFRTNRFACQWEFWRSK